MSNSSKSFDTAIQCFDNIKTLYTHVKKRSSTQTREAAVDAYTQFKSLVQAITRTRRQFSICEKTCKDSFDIEASYRQNECKQYIAECNHLIADCKSMAKYISGIIGDFEF
jgi:hypothetical protein